MIFHLQIADREVYGAAEFAGIDSAGSGIAFHPGFEVKSLFRRRNAAVHRQIFAVSVAQFDRGTQVVADDNAGTRHFAAADMHQRNAARISADSLPMAEKNGRRFFLSGEGAVFQTDMEIDF